MTAKSDPTIGQPVDTGDRLVGAGFKDSSGKYQVVTLTAAGEIPVSATVTPPALQNVNITQVGGNAVTTTVPVSGSLSVTSVIPGTGATNLGKAEDSAHSTGDIGVMALAVRNDAGAVVAGTDGDYVPLTTDATGALRVDVNGTVSTNNSSTVALAGNAAFTGTSDDCLNYNEIRISVIASHVSAADGLSIQQSSDNSNWDITDTYTIPATTGKTFSVPRQARYFRVVYTNGATLQTSFRLQTILNRIGARVSSQRAGDAYTNETDLEQQQSFLMGYNGSTWDRLRSDTTNGLDVDVTRLPALVAGAAIIGNIRIDQTTPGTTNGVQINAALPAGANGIGKLTANSGVIIGSVEIAAAQTLSTVTTVGTVTTVSTVSALGISTTGPQKAEDVASAGGDMGVAIMAARLDTPVANAGVSNDGDYTTPVLDNYRKVWVTGTVPEDTAHVAGEGITMSGERRIDPCASSAGSDGDWATKNQSAEGAAWATLTPTTASGLSVGNFNTGDSFTALTNTAQVIKASAGNLYGYYIYNPNATATYVLLYNVAAASVTVGTTNPLMVFCIPATAAANLMMPYPITFSNAGWSIAAATTGGGNTAPGIALEAMVWYK